MDIHLTFDLLPVLAVLLSLAAWYIPGFKNWYGALTSEKKQLAMAGLIFAAAAVTSLLSLANLVQVYPTDQGWQGLVWYPLVDFVIALIANTSTYSATGYALSKRSSK